MRRDHQRAALDRLGLGHHATLEPPLLGTARPEPTGAHTKVSSRFSDCREEKRKDDAVPESSSGQAVDDGQDEEVDGPPSRHPLGSTESQGVGGVGQKSEPESCIGRHHPETGCRVEAVSDPRMQVAVGLVDRQSPGERAQRLP